MKKLRVYNIRSIESVSKKGNVFYRNTCDSSLGEVVVFSIEPLSENDIISFFVKTDFVDNRKNEVVL